jgi:hypothetical protein
VRLFFGFGQREGQGADDGGAEHGVGHRGPVLNGVSSQFALRRVVGCFTPVCMALFQARNQ